MTKKGFSAIQLRSSVVPSLTVAMLLVISAATHASSSWVPMAPVTIELIIT